MNIGAWVLIFFAHVGPMGSGNSNALGVAYFENAKACQNAGAAATTMAGGTVKRIEYVCMPTK